VFERSNLEVAHEHVFLSDTLDEGIQLANDLILLSPAQGIGSPTLSVKAG
jgi:hypothetical protein